nr:tetratricopeptide repeat protein [Planctomycetota bacterium]
WRNLEGMERMLALGGRSDVPGMTARDRTDFFGVLPTGADAGAPPGMSPKANGLVLRRGRQIVARFKPSTERLNAAERRAWRRFLAYECHLHPEVRDRIADTGFAPRHLQFLVRFGPVQIKTTFKLVGRATADEPAIEVPPGFTLGTWEGPPWERGQVPGERPIDALATRTAPEGGEGDDAAEANQRVSQAVAAGRHLEAFLLAHVHYLQCGQTDVLEAARHHIENDGTVQELTQSMQPESAAEARRSLKLLERLRERAGSAAFVLDIYAADLHNALREYDEAEALFLSVLAENPRIAGVWHDLGDNYYRRYRMQEAWQCWDAGRRACQEHPMFEENDERERELRDEYPDFF